MSKADILKDSSKFQRVCSSYVARNVIYCVSSLMYELREVAENLDDYETYQTLTGGKPDYEEAAHQFVMNGANLYDLETIVEENGYWTDLTTEVAEAFPNLLRPYEVTYTQRDSDGDDDEHAFYCWAESEEHAIEQCVNAYPASFSHVAVESTDDEVDTDTGVWLEHNPGLEDALRRAVWKMTEEQGDGPEWVCSYFSLEPEYGEIYEHWLVDRYFGSQLSAAGEVVEEYMGLLIWGRTTTGQAISMDGVIQRIVSGLDDNHWIWGEA